MSQISAFAYVSAAVILPTEAELESLLFEARAFNAKHGVTGVLLYNDGAFFQYIEGHESAIKFVYSRIINSRFHHGIIELMNEQVAQRHFSNWHMGFSAVCKSTLLSLERANWNCIAKELQSQKPTSPGLGFLLEYWAGVRRGLV